MIGCFKLTVVLIKTHRITRLIESIGIGGDPLTVIQAAATSFYRALGYTVRPWTGGGIIDIGLTDGSATVLVQYNRWRAGKLDLGEVAQLHRACVAFGATRGVLMTSGYYTLEAERFAQAHSIELVSGDALVRLLERYGPRVGVGVGRRWQVAAAA